MARLVATFVQDLRFTRRYLRSNPGFALVVIVVLALGIGSSATVFSVLYQVLLKPLPYPNSDKLFFVHNRFPKSQVASTGVSGFDYAEIKRHKDIISDAGVFFYNDLNMTGVGEARHIDAVNASSSLFDTLGVRAQLGRTSDAPGTAVLSDAFWRSAFNGDPDVLGRQFYLTGVPYTVVGVMPASFQFPSRETQLWIPIGLRPGEFTLQGGRLEKWLHMIVRLAPGVSARQAASEIGAVGAGLGDRYPAFYPAKEGWRFELRQVGDEQTAKIRRWIYLAFAAVLSVLMIACINVTGLLLVRNAARSGEVAIRTAMGASGRRIVAQMLTETGALAGLSCALGLLFCAWALHAVDLYGLLSQPIPFQGRTVAFAILLTIGTTILAGLIPALLAFRVPVDQTLRSGSTRSVTGRSGLRSAVVAAQVACAVALVFVATELTNSFLNLSRVPTGFDQHVWSGAISLPIHRYTSNQTWNTSFYEPLFNSLNALPGVHIASGTNALPFNPSGIWTEEIHIAERPQLKPHPEAQIAVAFPNYFRAMGIPLLKGRTFTEADRGGSQPVAIIDAELALRYFPSEDPIGKLVASGGANPARIIGVVGSVHNNDLGGPREPELYFPEFQERIDAAYLVVRTSSDLDLTTAIRSAIGKLDPDVPLYDVQFMADRLALSLKVRRSVAFLLDALAAAGLLLALIGVYGSIAHFVELRRREIGIRAALGASRDRLVWTIVLQSSAIILAGLVAGSFVAILGGQAVRSQLYDVKLASATTWAAVLVFTLAAGLFAALVPALRAGRIEPAVALRNE